MYAVGSEILIRLNEITFMLDEIINRPKWYEFWKRDGVIMAAAQGALMKKNAIDTVKSVLSKAKGLIKRIF